MRRGTGTYFDGRSARRREVSVHLTPDGLRILELPDQRELASWKFRELRPVDEMSSGGPSGGPYRIRAGSGGALLVVDDRSMFADIAARAPGFSTRGPSWSALSLRWAALLAVSVALLVAVLVFVLPRFAEHAARLVPARWEESVGEGLIGPVVRQLAWLEGTGNAEFCTAPGGRKALDDLVQRLTPPEWPHRVRIRVANLKMVNAFALPGGQILLSEGLLRFAESPDEVAGIIAHEMGHVLHRHGTAAMIEGLSLGFLFGVMLGDLGASAIGSAGEMLVRLSFSREAESAADASAVHLLKRAGVATQGLVDFFDRMEQDIGDLPANLALLSTHPRNEIRIRDLKHGSVAGRPALGNGEWWSLRQVCSRREPLDSK